MHLTMQFQLLLPEGIRFSTNLVSVEATGQSSGHIYLQLTGDPSNALLPQLQHLMDLLYSRASNIPDVTAPVGRKLLQKRKKVSSQVGACSSRCFQKIFLFLFALIQFSFLLVSSRIEHIKEFRS